MAIQFIEVLLYFVLQTNTSMRTSSAITSSFINNNKIYVKLKEKPSLNHILYMSGSSSHYKSLEI